MLGQIITKYYGVKFSQIGLAINLSLAINIININRRQRHWERVSVMGHGWVPFLYFCTHFTNYHTILYVNVMSFVFGTESYFPIYYDNFNNFLSFLRIF